LDPQQSAQLGVADAGQTIQLTAGTASGQPPRHGDDLGVDRIIGRHGKKSGRPLNTGCLQGPAQLGIAHDDRHTETAAQFDVGISRIRLDHHDVGGQMSERHQIRTTTNMRLAQGYSVLDGLAPRLWRGKGWLIHLMNAGTPLVTPRIRLLHILAVEESGAEEHERSTRRSSSICAYGPHT
jgi:hypothetical protein